MSPSESQHHENLPAEIEALLFIHGEALSVSRVQALLGKDRNISEEDIHEAVEHLRHAYEKNNLSGLSVVFGDNMFQLTTKPQYSYLFESLVKEELTEALTPAALETLSIIAYTGPVSRPDVDYIRGVNSSFIVRALLLRGLIERHTDPERKNVFLYKPSLEFLKHIGISRVSDLPDYKKFQEMVIKLREKQVTEASSEESTTPTSS